MAQIVNNEFSRYFSSCWIFILTVQHQEIVLGQGPWILKKDGLQRKIQIKRNKQTKETDDCHPFPKWIHAPDFGLCAEKNHRQSFVKKKRGRSCVGEISGAVVVAKTVSSEKPPISFNDDTWKRISLFPCEKMQWLFYALLAVIINYPVSFMMICLATCPFADEKMLVIFSLQIKICWLSLRKRLAINRTSVFVC